MWEEEVRIYDTPGVPNNFPIKTATLFASKAKLNSRSALNPIPAYDLGAHILSHLN